MKLYVKSLLLVFGALLLTNCASSQSEVTQVTSAPTSVEKTFIANEPSDKLALTELRPELRDDEIICKTDAKIGSKLNTRKICATRKQWADSAEFHAKQAQDLNRRQRYSS